MTTTGQRIPPLSDEELAAGDDDTRARVEALGGMNIFRSLAHHPDLLRRWLVFGSHVLAKTTLPDREREIVILRTGWRCGSDYEFGQHTVIGRGAGLTNDEIRRLAQPGVDGWESGDATLVNAVDELVDDRTVSDATWEALCGSWSTQQIMDIVFAVGQYVLVSTALRTFGVERDPGMPGFPS